MTRAERGRRFRYKIAEATGSGIQQARREMDFLKVMLGTLAEGDSLRQDIEALSRWACDGVDPDEAPLWQVKRKMILARAKNRVC
jgi:hypothetical protein